MTTCGCLRPTCLDCWPGVMPVPPEPGERCAAKLTRPFPDLYRADCSCGWVIASPDPMHVLDQLILHHQGVAPR